MTVLAHGALGPADELIPLVPVITLLVLAVAALRRHNAQHDQDQPQEDPARR